jgi:hypothetical protein
MEINLKSLDVLQEALYVHDRSEWIMTACLAFLGMLSPETAALFRPGSVRVADSNANRRLHADASRLAGWQRETYPSGLTPNTLVLMVSHHCETGVEAVSHALAAIVDLWIDGEAPWKAKRSTKAWQKVARELGLQPGMSRKTSTTRGEVGDTARWATPTLTNEAIDFLESEVVEQFGLMPRTGARTAEIGAEETKAKSKRVTWCCPMHLVKTKVEGKTRSECSFTHSLTEPQRTQMDEAGVTSPMTCGVHNLAFVVKPVKADEHVDTAAIIRKGTKLAMERIAAGDDDGSAQHYLNDQGAASTH